ncbi:unnamed protein product [Soboliphyme baturini]|uniref:Protein TSSC4 n=1 Tax=Soboliphyme baturini TaxID=241478 RepID=A0A183ITU9_9BILA|nr:unnamed protein product [Soboliphyme baturini]
MLVSAKLCWCYKQQGLVLKMADDLDSFFASKKKQGKKKRDLRDPNALGRCLEITVQQQEIIDMINQEWENKQNEGEQKIDKNEDSEWIEVKEPGDVDLKELTIKELDIEDQSDMDDSGKEEASDKPKSWNMTGAPTEEVKEEAEPAPPPPLSEPKVYVAPSRRTATMNDRYRKVDVSSAVDFPSLAVADEIAKKETERKKKLMALKETALPYTARVTQRSYRREENDISSNASRSSDETSKQPSKPLYIPPARRHMEA